VSEGMTTAERLRRSDAGAVAAVARRLIKPFNNNLVPRPWGGSRLLRYKALGTMPEAVLRTGQPAGEAFEISAYDEDDEARRYPSVVGFADGSEIELPDLLEANGGALLGEAFVERYGHRIPLLPKTLDVKELLSVQGHPPGNTEAYIIIDADPGATIRLGFNADIDAAQLHDELLAGRRQQDALAMMFGPAATDQENAQRVLSPWLAARGAPPEDIAAAFVRLLESDSDWPAARALLETIKRLYWRVLDELNTVPVSAGQVIHNATPARLLAFQSTAGSAEVHALGNPDGREILALEIRRPGPTFRAWDNVRFPVRTIDIDAALGALNLRATSADEFVAIPELVPGRPGVYCSIDSKAFRIEHLRPDDDADRGLAVSEEGPHCLHAIAGVAEFLSENGESIGTLKQGESALVPIGVRGYAVTSSVPGTEVIKVGLPL